MKYIIEKFNNHTEWDKIVSKSLNNNIFLKSFYLLPLNELIDFYLVRKNSKVIGGFTLITDKKKI